MERIQTALAKARDERGGKDAPSETPPRTERPDLTAPDWQSLPELQLDEKCIRQNRIVALTGGPEGAAIDMMRTRVLQKMRENGWRRLAITSPTAECGKSTVSLNLAFSLQRQPSLKTVLMEADLRRPSLNRILGIDQSISSARVLGGTQTLQYNAVRFGQNLAISTSARPIKNSAELLGSAQAGESLSMIEDLYSPDLMIFDMPPMLVSDDVMAFMTHIDAVLLIAGGEATTIKEIDICETDLASQTNVMGVILNKCRYMGQSYGGYYE